MNNSNDELERFKKEINLAAFLEDHGFTYDAKKSLRNTPAFRGNSDYEMFIVSKRRDNGHHVFMNVFNEQDAGSIIDFVQRRKNLNLGEVRKYLRDYMGISRDKPLRDYHNYKSNALDKKAVEKMFARATALKHREFLHSRGISDATLDSLTFKNRIGNQIYTHSDGKKYANTVFPIYNLKGLAGLEKRNENYKAAAADSDKGEGMWFSFFHKLNPKVHTRFFLSESPIDALSKFQLSGAGHDDLSTLFFSSNGSLNKGQFEFVQYYIKICDPKEIVLGNDNDVAGARFNANYMGNLMDKLPTWEQENISFFLKPVTGDKSKLHLDIEIKQPKGKDGEKFYNLLLQEAEGYQSKVGETLTTVDAEKYSIRFTIPNSQAELEKVQELIHKYRPVKVLRIEKPLEKDFNEDLQNSLLQKKSLNLNNHVSTEAFIQVQEFQGEYNGVYQTFWVASDKNHCFYKTDFLFVKDDKAPDLEETKWKRISNENYNKIMDEMELVKTYRLNGNKAENQKKPKGMQL